MLKRIIKTFAGFALLPVAVALGWTGLDLIRLLGSHSVEGGLAPGVAGLALGLLLAGLLFSLLPRPMRAYVLGHELTHAVTAWVSGARVRRLRVSRAGGSVQVSRTGIWIDLSPYIVPPATLVLLAARPLYGWFVSPGHDPLWLGAAGLTWGFHVCFTLSVLSRGQPDVAAHGRLFSFVFITTANLAVGIGLLCLASPALRVEALPLLYGRAADILGLLGCA